MKPEDVVTCFYTAANNPETENLVLATPEELLHIRRKETVLELYLGCVVTEDPVLDAENMRLIVKLAYKHDSLTLSSPAKFFNTFVFRPFRPVIEKQIFRP